MKMLAPTSRIAALCELLQGPRVLHVGACGNIKPDEEDPSDFAHAHLVATGASVVAADINCEALRWFDGQGYETVYADAERLADATDEEFDSIVAGELIEHLSNPGLFLEGCAARLRRGGSLILSTPQPFTPLHFGEYLLKYPRSFNREHTCWFDPQTLGQLLARHGFEIRDLRFVDDLVDSRRSRRFRVFSRFWRVARCLMPPRLRTTIVVRAVFTGKAVFEVDDYLETWRR